MVLRRQFDTLKAHLSLCVSVLFSSFADRTERDGFRDDARSCVFGLHPSLIPAISSRWGQHALGETKQSELNNRPFVCVCKMHLEFTGLGTKCCMEEELISCVFTHRLKTMPEG